MSQSSFWDSFSRSRGSLTCSSHWHWLPRPLGETLCPWRAVCLDPEAEGTMGGGVSGQVPEISGLIKDTRVVQVSPEGMSSNHFPREALLGPYTPANLCRILCAWVCVFGAWAHYLHWITKGDVATQMVKKPGKDESQNEFKLFWRLWPYVSIMLSFTVMLQRAAWWRGSSAI